MNLKLTTTGYSYTLEEAEKLKPLGFTFRPTPGELNVGKVSRVEEEVVLKLETLEDLMAFARQWGSLIITDGSVEIYDDYRE